jgi:curved DNA-binding protein CbpA
VDDVRALRFDDMSDGRLARDFIDAYEVLGVDPGAGHEDIKAAYRRMAARHHPDVASGDQRSATARMQTINIAYGLIAQPEVRRRYDRLRRAHHARAAVADADEVWADLLQAAGRWVGRQSLRRRGGWYRAGYAVGRWLRT